MARSPEGSLAGRLLVAGPFLTEPTFRRTVILLLEHEPTRALGVVLNRASVMPVADPLPAWATRCAEPDVVFHGGPVHPGTVICLAAGERAAGAGYRLVVGDVGTVDLHTSPDDAVGIDALRVYSGYAGWGAGQLEDEIAEQTWIVVDRRPGDVFTADPERLWRDVVARQGDLLGVLADAPEEPYLN